MPCGQSAFLGLPQWQCGHGLPDRDRPHDYALVAALLPSPSGEPEVLRKSLNSFRPLCRQTGGIASKRSMGKTTGAAQLPRSARWHSHGQARRLRSGQSEFWDALIIRQLSDDLADQAEVRDRAAFHAGFCEASFGCKHRRTLFNCVVG